MRTTQARLRPETVPTAEAENRLGSQPSWLDPSAFPFESRFVELAGCRLHYVDEGAGPPLLFLHGSPMWSFMYRHCLAALRTRYRCLALDMPGLGLSTAPLAWGRQFARTAEVYGAFVDALDLRSLTVITHATAVPPALFMVAAQRARVRGCVITNGFGWPIAEEQGMMGRMARLMASAPMRWLSVRANLLPRAAARFARTDPPLTATERAAVLGPYRSIETRRHLAALLYGLRAESPLFARIEREIRGLSDMSVLLLYGADDHGCKAGFLDKWRAMLPDSEVTTLAGSGHFSPEDRPTEYVTALARWLDRGSPRAA
jgi:haloalkane dehalogenase